MKKSTIALIVVILLVIVGGFLYWQRMQRVTPGGPEADNTEVTDGENRMMAGQTFATLVRGGNDVHCEFTQGEGDDSTSGEIYISDRGERIRGDFMVMQSGSAEHNEAHMIRTNGWNYIWTSAQPQGMKMQVTAENREKLFEGENGGIPNDVAYNCVEWDVEASKFDVPTTIEFMDISASLKAGAQGSADMKAMQCAACEQAGAAREQCLLALKCE
jgi:hypothetical protein